MDERSPLPGPATAIAIVSIALGGMSLISSPFALLMIAFSKHLPSARTSAILDDPLLWKWTVVNLTTAMVLGAMRVAGGGGLLARRAWCRPVLNAESVTALVTAVVGLLVNLLVMTPRTLELMTHDAQNTALTRATGIDILKFSTIGGAVGGVISALITVAVSVATLVILTRPDVRAALRTRSLPAGTPQFPGVPGGQ